MRCLPWSVSVLFFRVSVSMVSLRPNPPYDRPPARPRAACFFFRFGEEALYSLFAYSLTRRNIKERSMNPIYLHGLGQTPSSWEKTIAQLEFAERCVCPNLAEICPEGKTAYKDLYNGFSTICDKFDGAIDLCGLSLGGVLALNYAVEHPEKVNSLVLIAAQYKMPKGLLKVQNILFQLMPKSMFQQTGFEKKGFIQLCKSMMELDFSNSIQKISCPALVVCGERDSANKKASMELANLLKDAEFQMISGSGHEVNIEAPEKLSETLCVFYKRVQ